MKVTELFITNLFLYNSATQKKEMSRDNKEVIVIRHYNCRVHIIE